MKLKILNAYAGIGGNRKYWNNVIDKFDNIDSINVVAVEHNQEIANYYKDFFPNDKVITCDGGCRERERERSEIIVQAMHMNILD